MARTKGSKNKPKLGLDAATLSKAPRQPRVPHTSADAAPLTDTQFKSLLMQNASRIGSIKDAIASTTGKMRAVYKQAKAEGIAKKDIDLVIDLQKTERNEASAAAIRRAKILEWVHPGALAKPETSIDQSDFAKAFTEGKEAGKSGHNGNPPYHGGPLASAWMKGWKAGQSENLSNMTPWQSGDSENEFEDPLSDAQNFG